MKKCTNCKVNKNIEEFSILTTAKDGRQFWCKKCKSKHQSVWDKTPAGKASTAKKIKKYRSTEKGKATNKKCSQRFQKTKKGKEGQKRRSEKYLNTAKGKKKSQEAQRAYKKSVKGRAKINSHTAQRRIAKIHRTPKWLTKEHWKQIENFYLKAARLTKETEIAYEVDHIIPLQGKNISGLHVPWNLQVITAEENLIKHAKLLS